MTNAEVRKLLRQLTDNPPEDGRPMGVGRPTAGAITHAGDRYREILAQKAHGPAAAMLEGADSHRAGLIAALVHDWNVKGERALEHANALGELNHLREQARLHVRRLGEPARGRKPGRAGALP